MAFSKLKAHLPKVGERRIPRLRRRELKLLASGRHGVNEALLVHGHHISKRLIAGLVRSGLAAAEPDHEGWRPDDEVIRVRITAAGRRALKGADR